MNLMHGTSIQARLPDSMKASSVAHAVWSCTLSTLATLPEASVSNRELHAFLVPAVTLHPHTPYLHNQLATLLRTAHLGSQLRIINAQLLAAPVATAAVQLVAAVAEIHTGKAGEAHSVRRVFESALRGATPLNIALELAAARTMDEGGQGGVMEALEREVKAAEVARGRRFGWKVPSSLLAVAGPPETAAGLWVMYLRWCAAVGALKDAHGVLLRGLSACPWSKGLWLKGIFALSGELSGPEVEHLLSAMQERGVVLMTEPSEILLRRISLAAA
jgi:hypothetical protein